MLKILVIGDQSWGKTSIVNRYIHGTFDNKIKATVAWEYSLKMVDIGDTQVRLNIWDIAGQDRLGGISKLFWRQAAGAIVVTDIMHENTLEDAIDWKRQVDEYVTDSYGDSIPMVLAVNKVDLIREYENSGQEIDYHMKQEYLDKFALDNGFSGCLRTSALENTNIDQAFEVLISKIIELYATINPETGLHEVDINNVCKNNSVFMSVRETLSTKHPYRGKTDKKWSW